MPKFSGIRYGAATLNDGSGAAIATVYVYGTGLGPQVTFSPVTSTLSGNPRPHRRGGRRWRQRYHTGATTNANCSLRDAVAAANGTSGASITFDPAVVSKANPGKCLLRNNRLSGNSSRPVIVCDEGKAHASFLRFSPFRSYPDVWPVSF